MFVVNVSECLAVRPESVDEHHGGAVYLYLFGDAFFTLGGGDGDREELLRIVTRPFLGGGEHSAALIPASRADRFHFNGQPAAEGGSLYIFQGCARRQIRRERNVLRPRRLYAYHQTGVAVGGNTNTFTHGGVHFADKFLRQRCLVIRYIAIAVSGEVLNDAAKNVDTQSSLGARRDDQQEQGEDQRIGKFSHL